MAEKINCACCSEPTMADLHYNQDGESICPTCLTEHHVLCSGTGLIVHKDKATLHNDSWYHDEYWNANFVIDWKDEYILRSEAKRYTDKHGCDHWYHDDDVELLFSRCYHTDELVFKDDVIEYNGHHFSKSGYGQYRDAIKNYSYRPDLDFKYIHREEQSPRNDSHKWRLNPTFLGFEIEVECLDSDEPVSYCAAEIQDVLGEDFVIKSDTSLNDGFECVSQPMTFRYIRERLNMKEKFEKFDELSVDGDRYNCGMHIHVPKHVLDGIGWWKVSLMMSKCRNNFVRFSRRSEARLREYTPLPKYGSVLNDAEDYKGHMKRRSRPTCFGRGAINFGVTHSQTTEFRLWSGTTTYEHFINTARMVTAIIEFARCHGYAFFKEERSSVVWKTFLDFCKSQGYQHFVAYINKESYVNAVSHAA